MNKLNEPKKGAAALITLIILSTVLLAAGITLIFNSIDLNKSLKGFRTTDELFVQSRSCLEDALSKIISNLSYTGTITLTSGDVTCHAVVTNDASHSNYKNINLDANDGEFYYSEIKVADTSFNPVKLIQ